MRSSPFWILLIGFMLLLDFYVFQALKIISHSAGSKTRTILFTSYWVVSISALILFIVLPYLNLDNVNRGFRSVVFAILVAIFFAKFITAIFLLIDDIRRVFQWMAGKVFFSNTEGEQLQEGEKISRSLFLTWIGVASGATLFGSLIYGFSNKYNYHIRRQRLNFSNLPQSFRGLKIIHISDIHSGSFANKTAVQNGIKTILDQKPDLILFTGDLVNNKADEMDDYIDVFSQLKAPMGVYSILGNHDYGDYVQWPDMQAKAQNLRKLKDVHSQLGWRLLINENAILNNGQEQIALLGVENWSAKARFPKYGDLKKAYSGIENIPFKILMSHDPSHWDAEVCTNYKDIDLMLAGHTHGMQFGVEIPWLKWSPVQYVYKQWAGLYKNQHQHLYVNRGFGFIGYPGRVGILPEITLLELV